MRHKEEHEAKYGAHSLQYTTRLIKQSFLCVKPCEAGGSLRFQARILADPAWKTLNRFDAGAISIHGEERANSCSKIFDKNRKLLRAKQ